MAKLRDIMSENLVTVTPRTSVEDVAKLMKQHDIGNVLVTEGDRLAGIVTDRDLVVRVMAEGGPSNVSVGDIMSTDLVTLEADTRVKDAAKLMADKQVRRLPVVENGKPVGIVSLGDLAVKTDSGADETALEGVSQPGGNN